MLMTMRLTNSSFKITVVYGPTEYSEKVDFLIELSDCQPAPSSPWLCLGDFNLIYEARDKNNGNINRNLMRRFRRALDASELIEPRLQNRRYTWSNGRATPTLVHLDRVFCNQDWAAIFPTVSLQALSSSLSDHCPLLLCTMLQRPRRAVFKFEHFWTRIPGFADVVAAAWAQPVQGTNALMILHNRLQSTARSLKEWSKTLFSDARTQLLLANEIANHISE
jgi:hypothetical protein